MVGEKISTFWLNGQKLGYKPLQASLLIALKQIKGYE
jgi:hypothetical protein